MIPRIARAGRILYRVFQNELLEWVYCIFCCRSSKPECTQHGRPKLAKSIAQHNLLSSIVVDCCCVLWNSCIMKFPQLHTTCYWLQIGHCWWQVVDYLVLVLSHLECFVLQWHGYITLEVWSIMIVWLYSQLSFQSWHVRFWYLDYCFYIYMWERISLQTLINSIAEVVTSLLFQKYDF